MKISIDLIDPCPDNPREHFSGMAEMADSITRHGLIEPVIVMESGNGRYRILTGERRWRAAQVAGLGTIECVVRDEPENITIVQLVENLQRKALSPMEEARAYSRLSMTQSEIGKLVGKTQSYIAHKIRLLKVPPFLTHFLETGVLTENHTRQALKLEGMYPPGLTREFGPGLSAQVNPEHTTPLLFMLRPENGAPMIATTPVHTEALAGLLDYVLKHDCLIPQWMVSAFWWESLAAANDFTVADFTLALDRWGKRYRDYAAMWVARFQGKNPNTLSRTEQGEYWAYHHVMRLNGNTDITQTQGQREWLGDALDQLIFEEGSYVLPPGVRDGR